MKERRPTRESFLKWKNTRKAKKNFPSMTDPELAWAYLCHFYKHGQLATHFCCAWPRVANRLCKKKVRAGRYQRLLGEENKRGTGGSYKSPWHGPNIREISGLLQAGTQEQD
jgi:hypothetical protein